MQNHSGRVKRIRYDRAWETVYRVEDDGSIFLPLSLRVNFSLSAGQYFLARCTAKHTIQVLLESRTNQFRFGAALLGEGGRLFIPRSIWKEAEIEIRDAWVALLSFDRVVFLLERGRY